MQLWQPEITTATSSLPVTMEMISAMSPPQPLLKLEPPGRHICDPGDFAEANDLAPGQVAHADLHVVHQGHVVLAIGKYVDIPHQHQVVVVGVGLLEGLTIHLGDLPVG